MSKTIEIQLRPFDYYFFGGEETFNSGARGDVNYYVKSNLLPQQSGLLGLVRHALFTSGYAIGESFSGGNSGYEDLISISSLFLTNNGTRLLPAPAHVNHEYKCSALTFRKEGASFFNGSWQNYIVEAPLYKVKEGLSRGWLNIDVDKDHFVAEDQIFKTKDHIGINKQKRMEEMTDEGAFYKQQFISLSKGFVFTLFAEVKNQVDIQKLPTVLHFGGERRSFHLNYMETGDNAWDKLKETARPVYEKYTDQQSCIILLSDAYVEKIDELNKLLLFAVMDEQPFRNLITPNNADNFGSFTKNPEAGSKKLYKAKKLTWLVKKGSVLYLDNKNKADIEAILDNSAFSNIGYNQYLSFNA